METVIYFMVTGLFFYFMMKGCCGGGHRHGGSGQGRKEHKGHGWHEGHEESKTDEKKKGCC